VSSWPKVFVRKLFKIAYGLDVVYRPYGKR